MKKAFVQINLEAEELHSFKHTAPITVGNHIECKEALYTLYKIGEGKHLIVGQLLDEDAADVSKLGKTNTKEVLESLFVKSGE